MAQPTVFSFGKGLVYIGDGEESETFTKICGFNSMQIEYTKSYDTTVVPDCDDPDAAAWNGVDANGLGWTMTFQGLMTAESFDKLLSAVKRSTTNNVRVRVIGAGSGGGTPDRQFAGAAHWATQLSAQRGQKWQQSVTLTGDGELVDSSVAALS